MATDLSDREAANLLGKHMRTVQRWCAAGKLPGSYKAGRTWRIPRRALQAAGLGQALAGDPVDAEVESAIALCDQIRAELVALKGQELPALGRRDPMARPAGRNWAALARRLERLEDALKGLPDLAAQVPRR